MNFADWYKNREEWRKVTDPVTQPEKSVNEEIKETYKPSELNMETCEMIQDIIMSTKGPYPAFKKKINLADLTNLVEEVWDDDDD